MLVAVLHEAGAFIEESQRAPRSRGRRTGRTVEVPMVLDLAWA